MKAIYLPDAIELVRSGSAPSGERAKVAAWPLLSVGPVFLVVLAGVTGLGVRWSLGGALLPNSGATFAIGCTGIVTLLVTSLVAGALRKGRSLLPVILALTVVLAPISAWAAAALLAHPIVHAKSCSFWCDPRHYGATYAMVPGAPMCSIAALLVAYAFASKLSVSELRTVRTYVERITLLALTASSAFAIAGVLALASRPRPSWQAYVGSLPVVAELTAPSGRDTPAPPAWTLRDGQPALYETRVGDWTLDVSRQPGASAFLQLRRDGGASEGTFASSFAELSLRDDNRIVVRRDAVRHLLYLESSNAAVGREGWLGATRVAFNDLTLERVDVTPAAFTHESGPPYAWVGVSLAGLAIALLIILVRPRSMRLLRNRKAWVSGTSDGSGLLAADDKSTISAPSMPSLPEGPIVVVRTGGHDEIVVPGSVSNLEQAVDEALAIRYAFALGVVVVASTPLVVAALKGFVW